MAKVNKLAVVDTDTGEVEFLDEHVIMLGKKPYHVDKGYVKLFITFLYDLVEDDQIAGKAVRLLMYMISRLDYNSYEIMIIPQEAIKDLRIARKTFYNWVNVLIDKGIIEKESWYRYRLKPYIAVKGVSSKAGNFN